MRAMLRALLLAFATLAALPASAHALPVLRVDVPRAIPNEPKVTGTLRMPGYHGRIGTRSPSATTTSWPRNPAARGSHTAEVRHLRTWLKRRIAWIDRDVGRL